MMAVLLIVGLVIGAGVGYFMAPTKTETEETIVEVEPLAGKTVQIANIISEDPALEWNEPFTTEIIVPDLNEYAELLGYDVEFKILVDSAQGQGAIHLEKVQSFKAMDVNLVIGGRWSSQAAGCLSYINENNILLWSPSSTAPTLRIADDNLYRLCPDDTYQGPGIAEMLWSYGIKAIIVIQRADAWADGIFNILKPAFEERGGFVSEPIRYQTESREFSTYLASAEIQAQQLIDEYGIEHVAVEVICFGSDGSVLFTQVEDYPTLWSLMWFGSDGSALETLIYDNSPSQAAQLVIASTYPGPGKSPVFTDLFNRYYDVTGRTFAYYDATSYDCATIFLESVLQAQSVDPMDLIPLQHKITYQKWGASGWTLLNEAGDRRQFTYDVWGYAYDDESELQFVNYGVYDDVTGVMTWFSEAVTPFGKTMPGLTPPGQ